jgi:serine/threonine-protein kinase HipA
MGRRKKLNALAVWMNGEHVGDWRRTRAGVHEFAYCESWLASGSARPISLSLPLAAAGEAIRINVLEYFDNLLPDSRTIRERIQRRFGTASGSAFDLLEEVGRDCVGAVQLLPEGETPENVRQITGERLGVSEISGILDNTAAPAFGSGGAQDEEFRISLAGAQEKTALLRRESAWYRPKGATPTTHIFKLPMGSNPQGIDLSTSVENEWLCAQIVGAYGIPVARCEMETFGDRQALVVERFDRRLAPDKKWIMRLPQEDFCQATGQAPKQKYECDGGPGIATIMDLLGNSEQATEDRRTFMRAQLVFWLLAAIDGHAKNFSIFVQAGGAYRLTPLYDIMSAHPVLGHGRGKLSPQKVKMAMAVSGKNRHYRRQEIHARHWLETARRCGLRGMESIMEELIEQTPEVLEEVTGRMPRGFPDKIASTIFKGTAQAADELADQLAEGS